MRKSYFYKLKDCEENKPFNRRSINGTVLTKDNWYISEKKVDKFDAFSYIIDVEEHFPEELEKLKHAELVKNIELEKEKEKEKQKAIKEEQEELINKKNKKDKKNSNKKSTVSEIVTITNDVGDIIDISKIKQIEEKTFIKSEREKYLSLTKREMIDIILNEDLKSYARDDFKNSSREDVLLTLFQVKKI